MSGRRRRAAGTACAAGAAAAWLGFLWANGPATGNDTEGYLRLARALAEGRAITSFRTPGYPLALAAAQHVARATAADFALLVAAGQTLLLAGAGTWLVFDLAVRVSGRIAVGVVAALLFAADADLQQFGVALLTEATTVVLAVAALRLRVADAGWARAGWLLAALALVRPNLAVVPIAFAVVDAIRLRGLAPAVTVLAPTLVLVPLWWLVSLAAGANPWRPYQWFGPVHTFGTVYESGLWQGLPEGPERTLLAGLRRRGVDPYGAVAAVERDLGEGAVARIARAAVRADPLGYAAVRAGLLRQVFRQGSFMRPELMQLRHPHAGVLAAVGAWREAYRKVLYVSFPLFVGLLALACWNGLGWPAAVTPFRHVLAPFVVVLFASTAAGSLSNYDVGRLGLAFHPVNAVLWALAGVGVARRLRAAWRRRGRGS